MEPGKSNLQLMLRYRLARFNPQRGRSWGVGLDWFTCKQHQGFPESKVWGHISKAWRRMVKGMYQIPPWTRMELLHSNLWWSDGVDLLKKGFTYLEGLEWHRKGIQVVDDIWDSGSKDFITWGDGQARFNLLPADETRWGELKDKVAESWWAMLEDDRDTTFASTWIGLYEGGSEDPTLVV